MVRQKQSQYDVKILDSKLSIRVGDQMRISKAKRTFKKGYLPSWTEEIFTVTKRVPRRPPVYKIADYHGEELEGTFYEQEYLVKWLGYLNDFNSWVPEDSVKDISK